MARPRAGKRTGLRLSAPAGVKRLAGRFPWLRVVVSVGLAWGAVELAASAHAFATSDPRFEARRLSFRPTSHVDAGTLRALLGIDHGRNLLSVDLDALARKVAEHPWVARATVVRKLPDTLVVTVEEYEPVALLAAGDLYLVDRSGSPFKTREPGEGTALPVITGLDLADVTNRADPPEGLVRALDAVERYGRRPRPPLGEVHVDERGGLTLYTATHGVQIVIGREDLDAALARFDALWAALGPKADRLARVALDAADDGGEAWVTATFLAAGQTSSDPSAAPAGPSPGGAGPHSN